MARRIPWDKEEAVIMLDALIKSINGTITREEAIKTVSFELRERGKKRGIEIDDIFRNQNGITLQMSVMENIYTDGKKGLKKKTMPKLFRDVVKLYKTENTVFQNLLEEAKKEPKKEPNTMGIENDFFTWLSKNVSPSQLSEFYLIFSEIESFCKQRELLPKKLFETTDLYTIKRIVDIVEKNGMLKYMYKRKHAQMIAAIQWYYKFLSETYKVKEANYKVDFLKETNLSGTVPADWYYFGKKQSKVNNWTELYLAIIEVLWAEFPNILNSFINKKNASKDEVVFGDFLYSQKMIAPKKLKNYLYVETFLSTNDILLKIRFLLNYCSVDFNQLQIFYQKKKIKSTQKNDVNNQEKVVEEHRLPILDIQNKPIKETKINQDKEKKDSNIEDSNSSKYAKILEKYFSEDGYQLGRAIYKGRFRKYYKEEYGEEIDDSEDIEKILCEIGTLRNGRIFLKQDKSQEALIKEIINDIQEVLERGVTAVYVEAVYEKYKRKLAEELQIYDTEALVSTLLSEANVKFKQKRSYFTMNDVSVQDSLKDLSDIMRSFNEPKTFDEIYEEAWFIPHEKIKSLLIRNEAIVKVAEGTYFYAENLPINQDERNQIIKLIQNELYHRTHIIDIELIELIGKRYPSIYVNTESFTTYGLRNCLGYILRDKYSFNGPIISEKNVELSIRDVYSEFAKSHDMLTLDELKSFSNEMNTPIYWDAILDEMVRISEKEMIRRDLINFDINAIDEILNDMCPEEYIALKDVNLYLYFPNIGYPWNEYILESYLYKTSKKFRLIHGSFGQTSVCGAMVRYESNIKTYKALLADALVHSDALTSVKSALQFIVDEGFQQRRRLDGIEELLQEARLRQEENKKKLE